MYPIIEAIIESIALLVGAVCQFFDINSIDRNQAITDLIDLLFDLFERI